MSLIKQKVLINTEKLQLVKPINLDKVFVLSLPLNEIHELGLMYLNYEILSRGYKTIYLGRVCLDNLKDMKSILTLHFVTYLTVQPDRDSINEYVRQMEDELLDSNTELWFTGWLSQFIDEENRSERMVVLNLLRN
jgi:hypothetical protein